MSDGAIVDPRALTVDKIEAIGRAALVERRRESGPAVVVGVVAALPGLFVPGVMVWWALLGVPVFLAARWGARRRLEQELARAHGVSVPTYRAIGDAYARAVDERKGDFTEVARSLQADSARLLPP